MDDFKPSKTSELAEDKSTIVEPDKPDYSKEEQLYIKNLQTRLEAARNLRSQKFDQFDGMDLTTYWQTNEQLANTELRALENKADVSYQSGTLRTKMMAFLSAFQSLNLEPDITAYKDDEVIITSLGNAMEDIIEKTNEMDQDEEKKMLRQYEMLKHGTVFVEKIWKKIWNIDKKITNGFIGKIKGVLWKTAKKLGFARPVSEIKPFLSVYLGDLRKYFINEQPYIFTVETMPYVEARTIFGDWERWQYVSSKKQSFSPDTEAGNLVTGTFRFSQELEEGEVEIVKYQDKPSNELQIIVNGILMLPVGYPLTSISPDGEYTVAQQNLEPIRHDFAYGKSFIFKNKNLVILLDEMMKLAVLKTQKSFMPPYLNLSGKVLTKKMFMPGQLTSGIQAGQVVPISDQEVKGVTNSEFAMIQEVMRTIDSNTSSQTFSGAREQGGKVTATQIVELQRQARVMMGILILAASLLEKKLTLKTIPLLVANWFDPVDETMDKVRNELKTKYRTVARGRATDEGPGVRLTVMSKEEISSEDIYNKEEQLKTKFGKPFRITVLNPEQVKMMNLCWQVTVVPKDKKSSEMSKMMFGAMVAEAMGLGLRLNIDHIEQRFAEVWEEDPGKMFQAKQQQPGQEQPGAKPGMPTGGLGSEMMKDMVPDIGAKTTPQSEAVIK